MSETSDIDGLLTEYFRGAMPEPWPTLAAPVSAIAVAPVVVRRRERTSARWALVASVAGLTIFVGWLALVAPKGGTRTIDISLDKGMASPPEHLRIAPKK